jgi:hypothetical protein
MIEDSVDYRFEYDGDRFPVARDIKIRQDTYNMKQLIDEISRQTEGYIDSINIYEDAKLVVVTYNDY